MDEPKSITGSVLGLREGNNAVADSSVSEVVASDESAIDRSLSECASST